ncbi:hypothetical protein FACS1894214_0590 [Planctomycetales bacterium]|nr:hypothetical protein FACS1894214_0590 [Planctomycetales bacterium]
MKCSRFVLISVSFLILFGAAIENVSAFQRIFRSRSANSGYAEQETVKDTESSNLKNNAFVSVSEKFLAVPFKTQRSENIDINEMINGTHVTGTGVMEAKSTGNVVSGTNSGVIAINVDGTLNSSTVGRQSVVTVFSDTTTFLHGVKNIYISPESITTSYASATAEQDSTVTGMNIRGGKIVRCIAKQAAAEKRPETEAIGRERTRRRFEDRIDSQVDERIAKVNENYQKKFREPLLKENLFPQALNFSSSEDRLNAFFVFGNSQQPAADSDIPGNIQQNDVLFQIHQTAVNNFAALSLGGKTFDEEKIAADVKNADNPFHFLSGLFNRNDDDKPLIVKFAEGNPVDVSFNGNTINAVIKADAFAQEGKQYPGLEITLSYKVKKEGNKIIIEQSAAPAVGSRDGKKVGASQTIIQTVVKRRLGKLEPQRVLKELEPKGEWEGKGKLVPNFIDSQNGWFSLSYNWVEK